MILCAITYADAETGVEHSVYVIGVSMNACSTPYGETIISLKKIAEGAAVVYIPPSEE